MAQIKIGRMVLGVCQTNCYFLYREGEKDCIVVDPADKGGDIYRALQKNGFRTAGILLTHGHFDHIGAVEEVQEKYGCLVCACEKEIPLLASPELNASNMSHRPLSLTPDVTVKEGDSVTVGDLEFKVMETPGHTEGSICFVIANTIFSGDTLFLGSCGRVDFPTGDAKTMMDSLKRLKNLEGDYVVYPGHGPSTTLEYERKTNPFM